MFTVIAVAFATPLHDASCVRGVIRMLRFTPLKFSGDGTLCEVQVQVFLSFF